MHDAFDSILPVVTLLLGAGLANYVKLTELQRNLRLDAADQLAELPALLWDKTDHDAWLKMNTAVSRLVIRLNLAGVHPDLTERVRDSALAFWHSVHAAGHDDNGDVWSVGEHSNETWTEVSAVVAELLGTNNRIRSWWIGRRAAKLMKKWDEQEQALLASIQRTAQ